MMETMEWWMIPALATVLLLIWGMTEAWQHGWTILSGEVLLLVATAIAIQWGVYFLIRAAMEAWL